MLESAIQVNENIDIWHKKLIAWNVKTILMCQKVNREFWKFFNDALDETFLLMKVVLVFALSGARRRGEFCNLTVGDVVPSM